MPDDGDRRAELVRELGGLTVRSVRDGDAHVIALAGEFDLATVDEVERELADAEATDAQAIVLDLSELQFINSSGLRVVVMAHRRQGARLIVVRGPQRVQRVFEMCGILDLLPFVDTPAQRPATTADVGLEATGPIGSIG